MTSLVHHVPRLGLDSAPVAGSDLVHGPAGGHLRVLVVTVGLVTCLLLAAVLPVAAIAGIDTHGRIPHPVPLPAPTGQTLPGH